MPTSPPYAHNKKADASAREFAWPGVRLRFQFHARRPIINERRFRHKSGRARERAFLPAGPPRVKARPPRSGREKLGGSRGRGRFDRANEVVGDVTDVF